MKRILLGCLSILLLITLTLNSAPAGAQTSCESACDQSKGICKQHSDIVYNSCREGGGSESACKEKRAQAYLSCMKSRGCTQCFDGRTGTMWYCACGRPYDGVSDWNDTDYSGSDLEFYDYDYVPYEYTWSGWGCDYEPAWCDPSLWPY